MGQDTDSMFSVKYREVPKMSYDSFETFSDKYTKPRVDAILLGSAEEGGQKEDDGGGYSQHVARQDTGPNVWFKWDAANIAATLNHQLIPAICLGRFPNLPAEYFPKLKLEPKEERDRQQEATILETASKLIPIAEEDAYDRLGFRQPKADEKTIFNPGGGGGQDPFGGPPPNIPGMIPPDGEEMDPAAAKQQQIARGNAAIDPRNGPGSGSGVGPRMAGAGTKPPGGKTGIPRKGVGFGGIGGTVLSGKGRTAAGNGVGLGRT